MKFSRTLLFLVLFIFFLLKLALSAEFTNNTLTNDSISDKILSGSFIKNLDLSNIFEEASNEIGIPFALRETLIEALREKGFLNLKGASSLFSKNQEDGTARDGHGGGGCSDSFAVFGFLAFLLALVDLLIDLGVIMTMAKRRKRRFENGSGNPNSCQEDFRNVALREGTLASYSLLRGFLNAMDAHEASCSDRFMCEAAKEASQLGKVGLSFARVASPNARSWLERINPLLHSGVEDAGLKGIELGTVGKSCQEFFPCSKLPKSYKFPGFK